MRVTLSGVRSTTHLVYAASYLRELLARTTGPVTLDYLGSGLFLGRDNAADADVEALLPDSDRLVVRRPVGPARWQAVPGERRIYLSVGVPGIKPYLRLAAADPLHRPHVVVIDEGIGSYGGWRTRRDAWRRQGGREPWPTTRALAVAAADRWLTDTRWPLYAERSGRWQVVEAVAEEFRRATSVTSSTGTPRAVFLTQPWVELGLVADTAYAAHLAAVRDVVEAAGFTFEVRPHPAEHPERHAAFTVGQGTGPAELDPLVVSAAVVLGADSTALLNLAAIHARPALRVTMAELAPLEAQLGRRQRELLDAFLPSPVPPAGLAGPLERCRITGT